MFASSRGANYAEFATALCSKPQRKCLQQETNNLKDLFTDVQVKPTLGSTFDWMGSGISYKHALDEPKTTSSSGSE